MKNLAKGSVFFAVAILLGVFFYSQTQVGAAFLLANDSQENNIQQGEEKRPRIVTTTEEEELEVSSETANSKSNKAVNIKNNKGMSFSATCYCLKGKTASGAMVRRGIVAADPRILPLGTRIQVNGSSHSGTYLVADTGGVIKGKIIDIWVPSCSEAIRFGRRKVTVTVLGKGGKTKS